MSGIREIKTATEFYKTTENQTNYVLTTDRKVIRKIGSIDFQSEGDKVLMKLRFESTLCEEFKKQKKLVFEVGNDLSPIKTQRAPTPTKRINLSTKQLQRAQSVTDRGQLNPSQTGREFSPKVETATPRTDREKQPIFDILHNNFYRQKSLSQREAIQFDETMHEVEFKPLFARKCVEEDMNLSRLSDIFKQENFLSGDRRPSVIRESETNFTKDSLIDLLQKNERLISNKKTFSGQMEADLPVTTKVLEEINALSTGAINVKKAVINSGRLIPRLNLENSSDQKLFDKEVEGLEEQIEYKLNSKDQKKATSRIPGSVTERTKPSINSGRLTSGHFRRQRPALNLTERHSNPFKSNNTLSLYQRCDSIISPVAQVREGCYHISQKLDNQQSEPYPSNAARSQHLYHGYCGLLKEKKIPQVSAGTKDKANEPIQKVQNSMETYITVQLDRFYNKVQNYLDNSKELVFTAPCSRDTQAEGPIANQSGSKENSENLGSAAFEFSIDRNLMEPIIISPKMNESNRSRICYSGQHEGQKTPSSHCSSLDKEASSHQREHFEKVRVNTFKSSHKPLSRAAQVQKIQISKENQRVESNVSSGKQGDFLLEKGSIAGDGASLQGIDINRVLEISKNRFASNKESILLANKGKRCTQIWTDSSRGSFDCNKQFQSQGLRNAYAYKIQNSKLLDIAGKLGEENRDSKRKKVIVLENSKQLHLAQIPVPTFSDGEFFNQNSIQESLQIGVKGIHTQNDPLNKQKSDSIQKTTDESEIVSISLYNRASKEDICSELCERKICIESKPRIFNTKTLTGVQSSSTFFLKNIKACFSRNSPSHNKQTKRIFSSSGFKNLPY